ncbi:hypothetical protein MHK_004579 [Candidatus Magnetomorum sp. HK-1]|nr:hypothetical protein MHK_004579 [Candidatus Magnetomorum sp. HK-1]
MIAIAMNSLIVFVYGAIAFSIYDEWRLINKIQKFGKKIDKDIQSINETIIEIKSNIKQLTSA